MRVNIIPMSGEGQRYKDAGYTTPKPLIEINGVPMVVVAARALPPADRWIFVARESHIRETNLREALLRYFKDPLIVTVDHLTDGQARTCMLARDHIPPDAALTIGPSDNDMTYHTALAEAWFDDPLIDGWIWTFRRNPSVLQGPHMYGWVRVANGGNVARPTATSVSCKVPLTNSPLSDHAVAGAFTFKRAQYFFDAFDEMVYANKRINGEFYVDIAADVAIRQGRRMYAFEVDRYIGWGTPQDLETFQYWQGYFETRDYNRTAV